RKGKEISLSFPTGDEYLQKQTEIDIIWESENINTVLLEYSTDAGKNWQPIAENVDAATGSYLWTIPNVASNEYKIRISDTENGNVYHRCKTFNVFNQQVVEFEYPGSANVIQSGIEQPLYWQSEGVPAFRLECSTDMENWAILIDSLNAETGQTSFTIPETITGQVVLKATALNDETISFNSEPIGVVAEKSGGGVSRADENTVLLMHFENDLSNAADNGIVPYENNSYGSYVENYGMNLGKAFRVDNSVGSDSHCIIVENSDEFALGNNWTIETWVNIASYGSDKTEYPFILDKGGAFGFKLDHGGNGFRAYAVLSNNTTINFFQGQPLETNSWYHISMASNASEGKVIFAVHDDEWNLMYSNKQNLPAGTNGDLKTTGNDLFIGGVGGGSNIQFDGWYDELHITKSVEEPDYDLPVVASFDATNISSYTAKLNGEVTSDGGAAITRRGFYWSSTNSSPNATDDVETLPGTTGEFSFDLAGLNPETTYYYRAFATNSEGTSIGEVLQFSTLVQKSPPTCATLDASDITTTSAKLKGNVSSDGNATINRRGFYWSSTHASPNATDDVETLPGTTGEFSFDLAGLNPETTYYYRAFATNSEGTSIGEVLQFSTLVQKSPPTCATLDASDITTTSAKLKGNVSSDGNATITLRGFYWSSTHASPNASDHVQTVSGTTGSFSFNLNGLSQSTTYYYRTFAINSEGTGIGEVKHFATSVPLSVPVCTTNSASDVTSASAQLNGAVSSDGGATIIQRGFYWSSTNTTPGSADHVQTVSGTTGSFSFNLTGLSPSTTYYYRTFAINSEGTGIGEVKHFATSVPLSVPVCTTNSASDITSASAQLNGAVSSDGGATIIQRGFYWSSDNTTPNSGDHIEIVSGSNGEFSYELTGLMSETTYYYCVFTTNSQGTATGDVSFFTTGSPQQLTELPFFDSFDNNLDNWTTVNVVGFDWWYIETGGVDGGKCSKFSTNMVKPYEINDDWMVSPLFNSIGQQDILITFNCYLEGDDIMPKFYYAPSFDGDPSHSDWTELDNSFWKNKGEWINASLKIAEPGNTFVFGIRYQSTKDRASYVSFDNIYIKADVNSFEEHSVYGNLFQVISNPVTSNSFIRFSTKSTGHVNLSVYTIQGEKICTLLNSNLPEGIYSVYIGDIIRNTGIFICTLTANQRIETVKLVKECE
ncbi:MAG TPA: T9SS type A sorting domain-containing protein, partial [Prolixibacteraceae bacterium]|nr:T9SS type A sorting domain-containing protein [Prolixibacteraceae bacterium]